MKAKSTSRRDFLKSLAATAAAAKSVSAKLVFGGAPSAGFDAKGLPTATLGRTRVKVPRIGIGLGSRFCAVQSEDRAIEHPQRRARSRLLLLGHGLQLPEQGHRQRGTARQGP